jgi:hypothetical protein
MRRLSKGRNPFGGRAVMPRLMMTKERKMLIRNLTPHPVTVAAVTYPKPDGPVPRVVMGETGPDEHGFWTTWPTSQVTDLPDEQVGVFLIVSQLTASAVPGRRDLVFPDGVVRDDTGRIVGAARLSRVLDPSLWR